MIIVTTGAVSLLLNSVCASPAGEPPHGLPSSDWAGIRQEYERLRHAMKPVDGGFEARNPGQRWSMRFDGRGFVTQPDGVNWQWGLELRSYGFPGQELVMPGQRPKLRTQDGRATYDWDNNLQEWFVNDARGLEHGFTVQKRPPTGRVANAQPARLNFTMAVRGQLRPEVQADGTGVNFRNSDGRTEITYDGLTVVDADGRRVPAQFDFIAESGLVRISVDDRSARYPLTVDPFARQAYLKASNTGAGDYFGQSVAISGDTVVVGAIFEDSSATGVNGNQSDNAGVNSGAAYVFVRNGNYWTQQAYLKASNTGADDDFGKSVAISGDTIVVGADFEDSSATGINGNQTLNNANNSGAAYVFVRNGTAWTQQAYLKASNTGAGDLFGSTVAISGDTIVVGAFREDSSATGVNGNDADNSATDSGAAYVFTRTGVTWTQQAYLKASNTEATDYFGESVAISGDTIVVGGEGEDSNATGVNGNQADNSASIAGAGYVFVRDGTNWSQQAYLKASNTESADSFGYAVAISGDTILVGALGEDSSAGEVNGSQNNNNSYGSGAAYVFVRDGTNWAQQAYLKAPSPEVGANFGYAVGLAGGVAVVGAPFHFSLSGSAHIYTRSGTNWTRQNSYNDSNINPNESDLFGRSVAVSGNTVVIGQPLEDSSTTGVNPNYNSNSAESGAAFVYILPNAQPQLLVDIDATTLTAGPLNSITNSGSLGGFFQARGGGATVPVVASVGGGGTSGILFDGGDYLQHVATLGGPALPASGYLAGFNPACTIEAWVFNGAIDSEETIVAWGKRGGPDGSNFSFRQGWDAAWGAVGHWGYADMGWTSGTDGGGTYGAGVPSSGTWHHLVYTFSSGGAQYVFADGVQKNSETVSINIPFGPPLNIAAQTEADGSTVTATLRGSLTLGRLRIYDSALTAAQVATNYILQVSAFTNGAGVVLGSRPTHRYQFNNSAGTASSGAVILDSEGAAHGTVLGSGATFTGSRLSLPGGASATAAYVDLPDGLLSANSTNKGGTGEMTIEGWAKQTALRNWARVFDFGSLSGSSGLDYVTYIAQVNTDNHTHRLTVQNTDAVGGTGGGGTLEHGSTTYGQDFHFAITWDDATGEMRVFENGALVGRRTESARMSQINDTNCWLGRSQWSGDLNLQGELNEFRIYNRILSEAELRGTYLRGPDNLTGLLKIFSVTGGGAQCGGVPVGLSGSETGVTYLLLTNSVFAGVAVEGTGAALNFGNLMANATCTVLGSNTTLAVTEPMNGAVLATVTGVPLITIQPTNRAVCGNPSVSFSVGASASVTPTYRWRKDGVNLTNGPTGNGSTISGATTATLTINPAMPGDAAEVLTGYDCVIAGPCETNSARVALTVTPTPIVFDLTGGATICPGGSTTITLSGSQVDMDYRMRTNGVFNGMLVAGTGSPLLFSNLTAGGTYTVLASNSAAGCTAIMNGSPVVVAALPHGISSGPNPGSVSTYSGSSLPISISTTGTVSSYQWRRDGTNLTNGGRISGATSSTLTISSTDPSDSSGTGHGYSCQINGPCGNSLVSSETAITVQPYGVLDTNFNPGANGSINAFAIQADGKILVGGAFTTLGGQTRNYLGRLNADGSLDPAFNPAANSTVNALAVQADGKIVVAGAFTTLGGQTRNYLGRLNADGTLDAAFNPGANIQVNALAVQADGMILVGGGFTTLGGQPRNYLGRLTANGVLDTNFNPGAGSSVYSFAVQTNGMILVGGTFGTLGGQTRNFLGRLDTNGTLDVTFNPGANSAIYSFAVQGDGKILVGGNFTTLAGQPRSYLGRLNTDGTPDATFNPGANSSVYSFALQVDGKVLVGGNFNTLGGQSRSCLGRLNADGALDGGFNPNSSALVNALAVQADGRILVGGSFGTLGGQSRSRIGRLNNTEPATQSLAYDGANVSWLRGGVSPEVWRTTFEASTNGMDWFAVGDGVRVVGGWQLGSVALPGQPTIRSRGFVTGGQYDGSTWFAESYFGAVSILAPPSSRTNEAGNTTTFTVSAVGSEPIAYQWRSSCGVLPDATNSALTLPGLTTNQSGCTYWVEVTNIYGAMTSGVAILTIAPSLADAVNAPQLILTNGGALPWILETTNTHDGIVAAQSGAITHSQESWMETKVTGPAQLSFWWSVSSEANYDFLEFYTNGVRANRISGTVAWIQQNFDLGAGLQVLRWRYVKDGSASVGQDRGYVDEVSFVGVGNNPPVLAIPVPDAGGIYGTPFNFTFAANAFSDPDPGQTLSYGASGLPAGITFTPATRTFTGTPTAVGTNSVTVTATDNGSPALSTNNVFDILIAKAPLTATADNKSRTYAETNPPLTFSYSAFVLGETAAVLDTPPIAGTTATNGSVVGNYPITIGGGADDHYELSYVNGTLTITPALLTVTAFDTNRVYGTPNPPLVGSLAGTAWGDNITATFATTATITDPPGNYPITPVWSDPDGRLANYSVTTNLGTLTILNPPELSITTDGAGSITLSWPASYSGFVLEFTESLAPADWQPVTIGITENGGIKSYTVVSNPNVPGRLYRLRLP